MDLKYLFSHLCKFNCFWFKRINICDFLNIKSTHICVIHKRVKTFLVLTTLIKKCGMVWLGLGLMLVVVECFPRYFKQLLQMYELNT
jgi:hypothetical protein